MITANYMTNRIALRPEFTQETGYWNTDMGALDAPEQIAAGSYRSVKAISMDYYFPLPSAYDREEF